MNNQRGFTLIELLTIISIISLLVISALATIYVAREKALATRLVVDIKSVENAFQQLIINEDLSTWPNEHYFGFQGNPPSNPSLSWMLTQGTPLSEYLPSAPVNLTFSFFAFDNDGDTYPGFTDCPVAFGDLHKGVNLLFNDINRDSLSLITRIDEIIDQGNGSDCGNFSWYEASSGELDIYIIMYHMAADSDDINRF